MSREHPTQVPWFVCCYDKGQKYQTFIPASANAEHKQKYFGSIPQLCDKTILACFRGWLLLRSNTNLQIFSLWNTVSFKTIDLPPLIEEGLYSHVLSSTTNNSESIVVLLCDRVHPKLIFYKVSDEQKRWTIQDISKELTSTHRVRDGGENVAKLHDLVCINDGLVYALSRNISDNLFQIQVVDQFSDGIKFEITSLQVGIPDRPRNVLGWHNHFVESCGELMIVIKCYRDANCRDISHVQVFKMDSLNRWVKVDNFKDRAIFLGYYYSLSCSIVDSKIKGNCIYFPENNNLYSFNKDDESLSLLMSPSNIRKFYLCNWIMLDMRLANEHVKIEKEGFLDKDFGHSVKDAEEKEIAEEANSCDLPLDIIGFIGKRLNLIDYMHFRITCREFQMAAPAIQWRTRSNSVELLYPLFVLFKNVMKTCSLMDPKYSERYFINFPELLLEARTHFSKNGWLLMSTAADSFYFFNPSTKIIHPLPKTNPTFGPKHIAFSSSPTSPDCVVVGIRLLMQWWATRVYVIRSRNGEWQEWEHRTFEKIIHICNNTPVFCHDRFWFLGSLGLLGVVKVNEDDFEWKALTKTKKPCTSFEFNYLVECGGELFSIFVDYSEKWVQVFKLDLSKMIWLKIKSLKSYMFFVSHSSSFSIEAKIAGMENKIYFPRLFCDESIIFYSLETEKFQSFTSEDSSVDFQFSSIPLQCGWIEFK